MVEAEPFLSFDAWGDRWLSDPEGRPIDFQMVQPDAAAHVERVIFPLSVEGQRAAQVLVRTDERPASEPPETDLEASPQAISNGHLRAELDEARDPAPHVRRDGTCSERAASACTCAGIRPTPGPSTPTGSSSPCETIFRTEGWVVEESGPLRARVRAEGWLGNSAVRWTLTLHRGEPRLRIRVEVNFSERFRLLQMPVHLATVPDRRIDGLPGGRVERAGGETEWPVQGWSRVDVEGAQLAMITGDAYSLSLDEDRWQWTLLRSPKMAWGGGEPAVYAGRDVSHGPGPARLRVRALGGRAAGRVGRSATRRASRCSRPIVFDRYEGMNRPPWGDSPPRALWLGAVERAMADGRMGHLADGEDAGDVRPLFEKPEGEPGPG